MTTTAKTLVRPVVIDDDNAAMMAYARSPEGEAKIAEARAEIAAGKGIEVDARYFEELKRRTHEAASQAPKAE